MKCEKCGGDSTVYLHKNMENNSVYRRRKCKQCGEKFTTIELTTDYMKGVIADLARITNDLRKR